MSTATRCIESVGHIGIRVGDVDQTVKLFVDGLGFTQTFRGRSPDGRTEVAVLALGAVELEVVGGGQDGAAVLDHIGLRTSGDLAAATQCLARAGIATRGSEIDGVQDSRAVRLDPDTTLGLSMHVSRFAT